MNLSSVDCIYVTASSNDARFTRICVASIRSFYPKIPIRLLVGGELESGLLEELCKYWGVEASDVPNGNWGWGFIKLEPLFGPKGEKFLVVDSDTVMTGPILNVRALEEIHFLVDEERQSDFDTKRLYYDWREVVAVDPSAVPPRFVFNTGQWFGTAGIISREEFAPYIDWSCMPPHLRYCMLFKNGDQGIFNYVLNQKAATGEIKVMSRKIMVWPGFGLDDITVNAITHGTAPPRIIHWAGMKASRLSAMAGGQILDYFERVYYERIPCGRFKRVWRIAAYPTRALRNRTVLRLQRLLRQFGWRNLKAGP